MVALANVRGGGSAAGSSTMLAVAAVKSACVNMTLAIDVVTSVGVHVVLLHADSSLSLGRGAGRGGVLGLCHRHQGRYGLGR
jgi:hypothetical protein